MGIVKAHTDSGVSLWLEHMDLWVEDVGFRPEDVEQFGIADPAAGSIVALLVQVHICLQWVVLRAGHCRAIDLEESLEGVQGEQMIEQGN